MSHKKAKKSQDRTELGRSDESLSGGVFHPSIFFFPSFLFFRLFIKIEMK